MPKSKTKTRIDTRTTVRLVPQDIEITEDNTIEAKQEKKTCPNAKSIMYDNGPSFSGNIIETYTQNIDIEEKIETRTTTKSFECGGSQNPPVDTGDWEITQDWTVVNTTSVTASRTFALQYCAGARRSNSAAAITFFNNQCANFVQQVAAYPADLKKDSDSGVASWSYPCNTGNTNYFQGWQYVAATTKTSEDITNELQGAIDSAMEDWVADNPTLVIGEWDEPGYECCADDVGSVCPKQKAGDYAGDTRCHKDAGQVTYSGSCKPSNWTVTGSYNEPGPAANSNCACNCDLQGTNVTVSCTWAGISASYSVPIQSRPRA